MITSIIFGVGVSMFIIGLLIKPRKNRFKQITTREKKNLMEILQPVMYWKITQLLIPRGLSVVETEDLLARAGRPWNLTGRDVLLFRIILPIMATVISLGFFGMRVFLLALQQITIENGIAIKRLPATGLPVIVVVGSFILGYFAPQLILKFLATTRERRITYEQKLFSEILFMSLRAKLSLREALEEAGKTTAYLRPYITKCLNNWATDRTKALHTLKKDVGTPSFQIIADLLIQAIEIGDENIPRFLEENTKLEEELKNIETSSKSKLRPIIGTVQMALPFIVMMFFLFYPLVQYLQELFLLF